MVLSITQGVVPPHGRSVAFEDDVLVPETEHEWWRRSIPVEIASERHPSGRAGKDPRSCTPSLSTESHRRGDRRRSA